MRVVLGCVGIVARRWGAGGWDVGWDRRGGRLIATGLLAIGLWVRLCVGDVGRVGSLGWGRTVVAGGDGGWWTIEAPADDVGEPGDGYCADDRDCSGDGEASAVGESITNGTAGEAVVVARG